MNSTPFFSLALSASLLMIVALGCSEYLSVKPDKQMALPETLADLQALLDNTMYMNDNYPSIGDEYADEFLLTDAVWGTLGESQRRNYHFDNVETPGHQWIGAYRVIFYCNLVLERLVEIEHPSDASLNPAHIEGAARFFRAYTYYQLAQLYAPHYDAARAEQLPGLIMRREASIDERPARVSLAETHAYIFQELRLAVPLLPDLAVVPTRPTKTAAHTMLARMHMLAGDYQASLLHVDTALLQHAVLVDYNTLDTTSATPFRLFNEEVIFNTRMVADLMPPYYGLIHPELYSLYDPGDLRRPLYYRTNNADQPVFKGFYDGTLSGVLFNGISTAELFLIKAECLARTGQEERALESLNTLLATRFKAGQYAPKTMQDTPDVLSVVLTERRKELVYRGQRWADLRRLAKEGRFTGRMTRTIGETDYSLEASRLPGFVFKLPESAVLHGGHEQQ